MFIVTTLLQKATWQTDIESYKNFSYPLTEKFTSGNLFQGNNFK
jgi:hypothetical protein